MGEVVEWEFGPTQQCILCGQRFLQEQCILLYCPNCFMKYCKASAALHNLPLEVIREDLLRIHNKNKEAK